MIALKPPNGIERRQRNSISVILFSGGAKWNDHLGGPVAAKH
jgi:hypothetical protein